MYKKKLFFYILMGSVFVSCAKSQEDEHSIANYKVSQVQVIDYKALNSSGQKSLSEIKDIAHYSLKLCFKDIAVGKPVLDQSFSIELNGTQQTKTTDFEGCVNWYGQIPHSTLNCEKVTLKNITIKGNDLYTGTTSFPLHFNPSAKSTSSFSDGRYISLDNQNENNTCEQTRFNIEQVSLIRKGNRSDVLEFITHLKPSLIRQAIDLQEYTIDLKNEGEFEIEANLIARQQGENILVDTFKTSAKIVNRDLKTNLEFKMPKIDFKSFDTQYMIEFTVRPQGTAQLGSYTGVITSNDMHFSKASPISKIEQKTNANSYLEAKDIESEFANTIEVKSISLMAVEYANEENYSQKKTKKLSLEACFYDNFSQYGAQPSANIEVEVTSDGQKEIEQVSPSTDEFGCTYFNLYTDYNLFGQRTWQNDTLFFNVSQGSNSEQIKRTISINPWLESSPFRDLEKSKVSKETLENDDSQLFIESIRYAQKGTVNNSYYINKFSQLFFKKRYELEFAAMVDLSKSFTQKTRPQVLNFGQVKINTYMLTPNHNEVDVRDANFEEMTLISATTNTRNIGKTGKVTIYPELPLEVSDSLFMASRAILVVELIPAKGLEGLTTKRFAIEFDALSSNSTKSAFEVTNEFSFDQKKLAQALINDTHAFSKGLANKYTDKNSLELFQEHLEESVGEIEKTTVSEFVNKADVKAANISALNMRTLFNVKTQVPRSGGYQKKLYTLMYPDTFDYLSRRSCEKDFNSHIKVSAAEHMIDVYSYDNYSKKHQVSKAVLTPGSEINGGKISLGRAYMAAKGTRSAQQWGTGNTFSATTSLSMYYDGPPSVILATKGFSWSKEEFDQNVNAKMQMEFTRTYSNLNEADLSYEQIELSFDALTKKCILIMKLNGDKKKSHICEDNPHERPVRDKWYFIGETDSTKNGVLTDGVKVGEKSYQRVIRGESNFKQIWKVFERDNVKHITESMQDFYLGETFLKYKREGKVNIDYEIYKDNSFPGLIKRR